MELMPRKPRRKGGTLKDGERRQLARASRHAGEPRPVLPCDRALGLCDGGSRGNPGTAAAAAILIDVDGETVARRAELIGQTTAAEAEYRAILFALELAHAHGVDALEVRSDSQLAVAALRAATPVAADLDAVVAQVRDACATLDVRFAWHPRQQNELADGLVRELLWP